MSITPSQHSSDSRPAFESSAQESTRCQLTGPASTRRAATKRGVQATRRFLVAPRSLPAAGEAAPLLGSSSITLSDSRGSASRASGSSNSTSDERDRDALRFEVGGLILGPSGHAPNLPLPSPHVFVPTASDTSSSPPFRELTIREHELDVWGDGTQGRVRLRFPAKSKSAFAGTTVTLTHDGEKLTVAVDDPSSTGGNSAPLQGDLVEQLRARGIDAQATE